MSIERAHYPQVPSDFPVTPTISTVPGAQPKVSLVEVDGKFYAPGTSPKEVLAVFEVCSDLVDQMVPYCQRKVVQFGGDVPGTTKAVFQGLLNKKWCTAEQSLWIMVKTAERLGWALDEAELRRQAAASPGL